MKTTLIIFLFLLPYGVLAEDPDQSKWKKADWYKHFDERLSMLEEQISNDAEQVNVRQDMLNKEMIRLNEKLENRFDKYFLWGYGTLLVVLSTITNVVFNKRNQGAVDKEKGDGAIS